MSNHCLFNNPSSRYWAFLACLLLIPATIMADERDEEIRELRQELEALKERIRTLEQAREAGPPEPSSREAPQSTAEEPVPEDSVWGQDPLFIPFLGSGAEQLDARESREPPESEEDEAIEISGALRFNYFHNDFNESLETKRGSSGLDLFRIGIDGAYDNVLISAEYRWYSYMDTLHHGWIGYEFQNEDQVQVGVSQVPFGILPYAAHNFWFGIPYYLGLSDDYDLGVQYIRDSGPWNLRLGFYKNEELGNAADLNRYSYDVVKTGPHQNEETNQFNSRLAYTIGKGTDLEHELGVSAQWGELFNTTTGNSGDHWAVAGHVDSRMGRWNLQLEAIRYRFDPRNPAGMNNDLIRLGAFADSYDVSAEGSVGVLNIAYNLPVPIPVIENILIYNDYSILHKDNSQFDDSQLNTTGAAFGLGPLFIYLDLIHAHNMIYFSDGSLAGDGDDSWSRRVNLNLGYYW